MSGEVCNDAMWKGVMVVKRDSSFDPVQWIDDGNAADWQGYLKSHLLAGSAVSIAVFALVAISLLSFLAWRLFRCCCACCAKDGRTFDSREAVLTNPWFTYHKVIVVVFGLGAIGMAIAGMIKLPKDPLQPPLQTADDVLGFATSILDAGDELLQKILSVNGAVDGIQAVLDVHLKSDELTSRLQALGPFLDGLPNPGPIQTGLQETDALVMGDLSPQLSSLAAVLSQVTDKLLPAVSDASVLSSLLLDIHGALSAYTGQLSLVQSSYPGPGTTLSNLQAAQDSMQVDSWLGQLASAVSGLQVIEQAKAANTLSSFVAAVQQLQDTASSAHQSLTPLLTGLVQLNASDPVSAAANMATLSALLKHINSTVVRLDASTQSAQALLDTASSALAFLYCKAGEISSWTIITAVSADGTPTMDDLCSIRAADDSWAMVQVDLPWIQVQLQAIDAQLVKPIDASGVAGSARNAQAALASTPSSGKLQTMLGQLQQALQTVQPSVQAVGQALKLYTATPSAATYSVVYSSTSAAQPVLNTAQPMLTASPDSDSRAVLSTLSMIESAVGGAASGISSLQSHIITIQMAVAQYPHDVAGDIISMLGKAASAYDMLPTPHSDLIEGPLAMLNSALSTANKGMADVRTQIADASQQVRDVLDGGHNGVNDISSTKLKYSDKADKYWGYAYKGLLGAYGLVIAMVLLLAVLCLVACRCGVVTSLLATYVVLLLWLVLSTVVLGTMVVLQDGCGNAEAIITAQVMKRAPDVMPLAQYYLYADGAGVKAVLKEGGIVDVDDIQAQIDHAQESLINSLQKEFVLGVQLSSAVMATSNAVDAAQSQVDSVLVMARYEPVHAYYLALKSSVCCEAGGYLFVQWICITCSALLGWLSCCFATLLLTHLDRLKSTNCCGAECFRLSPADRMGRWGDSGGGASATTASSGGATSGGGASDTVDAEVGLRPPGGVLTRIKTARTKDKPRPPYSAARAAVDPAAVVLAVRGEPVVSSSFDADVMYSMAVRQAIDGVAAGGSPATRRTGSAASALRQPSSHSTAAPRTATAQQQPPQGSVMGANMRTSIGQVPPMSPETPAAAAVPVTPGPGGPYGATGLTAGPAVARGLVPTSLGSLLVMQDSVDAPAPAIPSAPPAPAPDAPNTIPSPGAGAWAVNGVAAAGWQQQDSPQPGSPAVPTPTVRRPTVHLQVMDEVAAAEFVRIMQSRQ